MKLAIRLLSLTFAGVFVEITYCVWGLTHGEALWIVPLVLGAYHSGYILARTSVINRYSVLNKLLLVIAMLVIATGTYLSSWSIIAIGVLTFSTSLQILRRSLKEQISVNSRKKNFTKSLAMVSGSIGVLSPQWLALVVVLVAMVLIIVIHAVLVRPLRYKPSSKIAIRNDLLWFEFLHHAHYFAYCYTFWALFGVELTPFVGPLFLIGWLGYFVLEWLLRERFLLHSSRLLMAGHLICAAALWSMLLTKASLVILLLWFITGIGGGTAYMLGNTPNGGDRELYEDLGHIVGCFSATLVIFATGLVEASIVLGIGLALGAAGILAIRPVLSYVQERNL